MNAPIHRFCRRRPSPPRLEYVRSNIQLAVKSTSGSYGITHASRKGLKGGERKDEQGIATNGTNPMQITVLRPKPSWRRDTDAILQYPTMVESEKAKSGGAKVSSSWPHAVRIAAITLRIVHHRASAMWDRRQRLMAFRSMADEILLPPSTE